jgi:hypothetical protein
VFNLSELKHNLMALPERSEKAVMSYGKTSAAQLTAKAKIDRPWTDRTAQARQRLHGDCKRTDTGIRITLSHGVDYGIYLELAHEKRYAVIYPTLQHEAPKVMEGLRGLFNRL